MEAESFFLPGRKQKEGRRSVPSIMVTGLCGRLDRQWQFKKQNLSASSYETDKFIQLEKP